MSLPPMTHDAAVTFDIVAYQPWPAGEVVTIGEVTIGQRDEILTAGEQNYGLVARVELPDDENEMLVQRARGIARSTIELFYLAQPRYPLALGNQYWVERLGKSGGVGFMDALGKATIRRPDPLPASDLAPVRTLSAAFGKMKETPQRRSRAAVYWLEQSRTAPDAAQRVPAACFAIESAIDASGKDTVPAYLTAIENLGFFVTGVERERLVVRLGKILAMRANVVHHGHLDKPSKEPKIELWARDLATAIVIKKLGLRGPTKLSIFSD